MNRENTIQLLQSNVHPQTMIQVIFEYIFDRTGKRVEGQINFNPFDLMLINQMYQDSLEWFRKKFNVNMLYNQKGELIKIF